MRKAGFHGHLKNDANPGIFLERKIAIRRLRSRYWPPLSGAGRFPLPMETPFP